jgi:hypothetical protein
MAKTKQTYMKAVLPASGVSNARNDNDKRELVGYYKLIDKKTEKTVIDCRLYMGKSSSASAVHCSLWVRSPDMNGFESSGRGTASGYGYHKQSASVGSAIANAGIELFGSPYGHPVNGDSPARTKALLKQRAHIGGCGSGSLECALAAIAYALGCTDAVWARG